MAPIIVAIAGSTGLTGLHIAQAFLSPAFHPHAVARLHSAAPSAETLKGVDVVINALNTETFSDIKDSYARAAAEASVKVYICSEYGFDHYKYQNQSPAFVVKRKHDQLARSLNGGSLKVISVLTAIFLEFAVGPQYGPGRGIDVKNRVVESVGSLDTVVSFNSLVDVGSTVARVSILAAEDRDSVPDRIRISGDARSFNEVAGIIRKELGGDVMVKTIEVDDFEKNSPNNLLKELRLRFASGEVNFAEENNNELVNPGEKYWKWKKVPAFVKETFAT